MARPSKLTPDLRERVVALVRAGNTIELASDAVGIHRDTFYDWMARGEKTGKVNQPHREFRDAVLIAQAEAEATLVTRIAKAAAGGSWGAAAWLLERRSPDRWAKPSERKRVADDTTEPEAPANPFDELDELAPRRQQRRRDRP